MRVPFRRPLRLIWNSECGLHSNLNVILGYGEKKPLIIFLEDGVELGGLPSYQEKHDKVPRILFDRRSFVSIRPYLDNLMPRFRKSIENKRWSDLVDGIKDFLIKASIGAAAVGVIYGLMEGFQQSENSACA